MVFKLTRKNGLEDLSRRYFVSRVKELTRRRTQNFRRRHVLRIRAIAVDGAIQSSHPGRNLQLQRNDGRTLRGTCFFGKRGDRVGGRSVLPGGYQVLDPSHL